MEEVYKLGEIRLFTEEQVEERIDKITFGRAPLLIHQRFCHELVKISKENKGKKLNEVKEFMDMLTAINILEKCYPELKKEK